MQSADPEANPGNPPRLWDLCLAHTRPWPALPAACVLLLTLMWVLRVDNAAAMPLPSLGGLALVGGLLVSCGLAVAAGFCSLFPQTLWLAGAVWALALTARGLLPAWAIPVLYTGIAVAASMLVLQLWRIRTGRFVPTIAKESE